MPALRGVVRALTTAAILATQIRNYMIQQLLRYIWLLLCGTATTVASAQLCDGSLSQNILPNGDFGSGAPTVLPFDPMLAPGYTYDFSPPPNDGFYTVANNTSGFGSFATNNWIDIGDNSPDPDGYMMIVNAADEPGIFYEQSVVVCENTTYQFSADIINMAEPGSDNILPNVDFLIDGAVQFGSGDIPEDAEWRTYGFTFTTGVGASTVTLTLRNNAPGGNGNDLALDNISFRVCGPELQIDATSTLCDNGTGDLRVVLNGGSFDTPAFQWQISTDNGTTWTDIAGATTNPFDPTDPVDGAQYRVVVANAPGNLNSPSCRVISTATTVNITSTNEEVTETICAGSVFPFDGQLLTESGTYTAPTNDACNGFITVQLTVRPPGIRVDTFELCPGTDFEGTPITMDTELRDTLQTAEGCDSFYVRRLRLLPTYEISETRTGCAGDLIDGFTLLRDTTVVNTFLTNAGCDSTLIINYIAQGADVNIAPPPSTCEGETLTLSTTETYVNYQWSTGSNAATISVTTPGTYAVTVTTGSGCSAADMLAVDFTRLQPVLSVSDPNCQDEFSGVIRLESVGGGLAPYVIGVNDGPLLPTDSLTNLTAGSYALRIEDAAGCAFDTTLIVDAFADLTLDLGADRLLRLGDSVTLSAVGSGNFIDYVWTPAAGLSCTDCPDPVARPLETTLYTLTATDAEGCTATASIFVRVDQEVAFYAPNVFSPNEDGRNDRYLIFTGPGVVRLTQFMIFDRWGSQVYSAPEVVLNNPDGGWDGTGPNGQTAPTGVYAWWAELELVNGNRTVVSGDLTLLR